MAANLSCKCHLYLAFTMYILLDGIIPFMPYYTDVVRHNSSKTQFIRTPVSYSKVLRRGEHKL